MDPLVWAQRADDAIRELPLEVEGPDDQFAMPRLDAAFEQATLWANLDRRQKAMEMIGLCLGAGAHEWATPSTFVYVYARIGNQRMVQFAVDQPEDDFDLVTTVCDIGLAQFFAGERDKGMEGMLWAIRQATKSVQLSEDREPIEAEWVGSAAAGILADTGHLDEALQLAKAFPSDVSRAGIQARLAYWYRTIGQSDQAEALVANAKAILAKQEQQITADAEALEKLEEQDQADKAKLLKDPGNKELQGAILKREEQRDAIVERQVQRDDVRCYLAAWSVEADRNENYKTWIEALESDDLLMWAWSDVIQAHWLVGRETSAKEGWTKAVALLEQSALEDLYWDGFSLGYAAAYGGKPGLLQAEATLAELQDPTVRVGLLHGIADGLRETTLREANLKPAK